MKTPKIFIFGTGDNGLQVYYIVQTDQRVEIVGFLDDDPQQHGRTVLGLPVLGGVEQISRLKRDKGVEGGIVAIGDNFVRAKLQQQLREQGVKIVSAIHPTAIIDSAAKLGEGVIVEMGAQVHPEAEVGVGVFIGGGAIVSHNSVVGDYCLLGGRCVFGSAVRVGAYSVIGVGAAVAPHTTVGSNVVVGVGAAVVRDLPDDVIAVGVPAKVRRPNPRPQR